MVTKIKVTFVVPQTLQQELREKIIKESYGLRGKSKWVGEAIESLLQIRNFPQLVSYNEEMHGFEKVETVVIDLILKRKLEQAIIAIRKEFPTLEGVQSNIIRTAILQRLLRS